MALVVVNLMCDGWGDTRKGDYYRYLAEFKTGNERKEAADQSLKAYQVCIEEWAMDVGLMWGESCEAAAVGCVCGVFWCGVGPAEVGECGMVGVGWERLT